MTPKPCPYCGKPLKPRVAELMGRAVTCGFETCSCDGAAKAALEEEERRRAEEFRQERERLMRRYQTAGIPPLFLQTRKGCEDVYKVVRREAKGIIVDFKDGKGTYIVGGVGTRKSLVAATACRYAVDEGLSAKYTSASKVLDAVRGSYGTSKDSKAVMDSYASTRFLVLDDLGKESPTDWTLMKLFEFVNDRYENMRPLVVTTQYKRSELIQRLGKNGDTETAVAIVSRLTEMCGTRDYSGADQRMSNG